MMFGNCSASGWPTMSTKYGASASSARGTTVSGSCDAASAASAVTNRACDHLLQHDVASVACALRRRERRQVVRRVDHARDRRGLGEREVADVLAEEEARALGDAVDRERPALSEVHLVQVELEDLVLRRAPLEHERHELLGELAPPRFQAWQGGNQAAPRPSSGFAMTSARKMFLTSCCVMVLPPSRYRLSPDTLVTSAPTIRIGSMPGCS